LKKHNLSDNTMYILCIYLHIHAVKNTTTCQIVALCNTQLHVSALYVGHHQVVRRISKVTIQHEFGGEMTHLKIASQILKNFPTARGTTDFIIRFRKSVQSTLS